MHAFILCHLQLSIGHPKTHPKISDSLQAIVLCPRFFCHLLNFLAAGSQFFIWNSDIIEHVHDKVLESHCFLSSERLSLLSKPGLKLYY